MKEILVERNDEYGTHWCREKLIHCKECKFYDGYYCNNEWLNLHLEPAGLDGGALFCPPEDFYCAYAKGRE